MHKRVACLMALLAMTLTPLPACADEAGRDKSSAQKEEKGQQKPQKSKRSFISVSPNVPEGEADNTANRDSGGGSRSQGDESRSGK